MQHFFAMNKPGKVNRTTLALALFLAMLCLIITANSWAENCAQTLNFTKKKLASNEQINLCNEYKDKVVLIVNTASFCGFTKQYKGLESLYQRYHKQGLVVLGFPSNDFGEQDPGSEHEIAAFCERTFNVKFPMFAKTKVAKGTVDPLYTTLASIAGEYPKWNFHKYLITREGKLVGSYASKIKPNDPQIISHIEKLL